MTELSKLEERHNDMAMLYSIGTPKKQALAIFYSLKEKATVAVLEIHNESLNKDDGVDIVLVQLDKLYLKDKTQLA